MGWSSLADIVNKFLPNRVERLRDKRDKLKEEERAILKKESTPDNNDKLLRIRNELRSVEKKLYNRK